MICWFTNQPVLEFHIDTCFWHSYMRRRHSVSKKQGSPRSNGIPWPYSWTKQDLEFARNYWSRFWSRDASRTTWTHSTFKKWNPFPSGHGSTAYIYIIIYIYTCLYIVLPVYIYVVLSLLVKHPTLKWSFPIPSVPLRFQGMETPPAMSLWPTVGHRDNVMDV